MPSPVTESDLENAALTWFAALGYEILPPDNLAPDSEYQERTSAEQVILEGRLRTALHHLNPTAPPDAIDDAVRRLQRRDAPTLLQNNLAFHRMLADGITVEVPGEAGGVRGVLIKIFDFDHPEKNNDWLVTHQIEIVDRTSGTGQQRRPDIVVYVNGLPLAVLELKNPTSPSADVWDAYNQIQTYTKDIPSLFVTNALLVASDDVHARIGPLGAPASRFAPWRTIGGEHEEPEAAQPLKVLIAGVFDRTRFLDLARSFVTFEQDRGKIVKKLAGYHQFHAVRRAVAETVRASRKGGDRRIGVVWHTQGSGKSLTMVFYAGKLILEPAMENPTIVVLTDCNDLDEQLFGTFSRAQALLRQEPIKADSREHLRDLLQKTASGGIYFTTVQKFLPPDGKGGEPLSPRRNIVVIADEAHRSQYGFKGRVDQKTGALVYGLAKHMRDALPAASFIGFTGTPIELDDKSTTQVFGETISIYDIRRSVDDGATVPIYYENRLAKLDLDERERPNIDPAFEEVTEGEEDEKKEALKTEWSTLETLVGTPKRIGLVAADLVAHFDKRLGVLDGKALVVCMSRRVAAEMYDAIVKLRPAWHDVDDDGGAIKVVITGSAADSELLKPHIRTKARNERLADRFKDPADPLKIVIVRDMWLTGFDAPCLHTLYVDKPMRGHNLMQAIARVNRVFGDKPGGLVVDYLGIATFLKEAMETYARRGGTGDATSGQEKAVEAMLQKLEVCRDVFHGFDYAAFFTGTPAARLELLPAAREHVLRQRAPETAKSDKRVPDGHDRFLQAVADLSSAFTLAMPHEQCDQVRDEVAFFQAVKVGLVKLSAGRRAPGDDLGHAVRQIVENAIVTEEVIDIFAAAGLPKPDISILSDEFLAEVRGMKHPNLAVALLRRLLEDEIKARGRRSVIQARSFAEMPARAVQRYLSRGVESAQVIEELLEIARAMRAADAKGERIALSSDELAFYEALADNASARDVLGDDKLAFLARELTRLVRQNATIDWTTKRTVQAKLRVLVKRVLKDHGYPPDGQQKATDTVLEQAKLLGINVVDGGGDAPEAAAPVAPARPLPYPIAVFDPLVASQETAVLRVKTRRDGIEKALSFLVGAELALLRELAGGTLPEELLFVLKDFLGKPISMGAWLDLACKLAARLPVGSADPVARAARALVTPEGRRSELAKELAEKVVEERNLFSHAVTPSEEAVAREEAPLHALWKRFEAALAPLAEAELVSEVSMVDADLEKKTARYRVRVHQGPADRFPVEERQVAGKLGERWCYLLHEGQRPLLLSPVICCALREEMGYHEVFMARTLALEPGSRVEMIGVATMEKVKAAVAA